MSENPLAKTGSDEGSGAGPGAPGGKPRCGLCGKTGKLTRTPCCGNWICDDADQYVPFSYARNSCFTNHSKYTICALHHHQQHEGRWQDCAACRTEPLELYVHHATNKYNFEKLADPPKFEPTFCAGCGVVINLVKDGYMIRGGGDAFECEACRLRETGVSPQQMLEQFRPAAPAPSGLEDLPVRRVGQRGRFPAATLAYYGPDNTRATKLAVSIVHEPDEEPRELHRWITQAGDIREDAAITAEVESFLKQHRVKQRIITDRIIGCPHEEGKDYPEGGECPHCPFWHNRDRFTHELRPEWTPVRILEELAGATDFQPIAAIRAADAHREALVEPLLRAMERGLANPRGAGQADGMLFSFATYLLARWREVRAYPFFIRWLSLPGEDAHNIGGDTVTQDGGRFLAMVCGGDLEPIKGLILNREADEFCRGQAVTALALLAAWGEAPQSEVEEYFVWLIREGLEPEAGFVWNEIAMCCVDIEAHAAFPDLRRAMQEGKIDPGCISPDELEQVEKTPGKFLAAFREHHDPVVDVVRDTAWWEAFSHDEAMTGVVFEDEAPLPIPWSAPPAPQPFRAPPRIGRNDPCPCGSGKKYKKCCGR